MIFQENNLIFINNKLLSIGELINNYNFHDMDILNTSSKKAIIGISGDNDKDLIIKIFSAIKKNYIPALNPPQIGTKNLLKLYKDIGSAGAYINNTFYKFDNAHWNKPEFDIVMFSSGSTGEPVPLGIKFKSIKENALQVKNFLKLSSKDIHMGSFSICYMSGFYNALILPMLTGGIPVVTSQFKVFNTNHFIETIKTNSPTVLWLSPLVAKTLVKLKSVEANYLKSIRYVISCTAPLNEDIKLEFQKKFKIPLLQSYGLCETLITTIQSPLEKNEKISAGRNIGPMKSISFNKDKQIIISNNSLYAGVLKGLNKIQKKNLINNSYCSNDIGFIDVNKNLIVTGRIDNQINIDGKKISAESIEDNINKINNIISSAISFQKSNNKNIICLIYSSKTKITNKYIIEEAQKYLPNDLIPNKIINLPTLPLTNNDKIDRKVIDILARERVNNDN